MHYSGKIGRYNCYGARTNHGAARCISISGVSIDAAISSEVLRVLKPLGIEAALKAIEAQSSTTTAAERQLELSLQQARYEASHARRQYDAVDPANRLVAGELERRWNEALQAVAKLEGEIAALIARHPPPLGEPERRQLVALGADLERAWLHPAATAATRKRILRTALTEIVVRRDGAIIHAVLHWQGGDHTQLQVKQRLNAAGRHNPRIPDDTIALVRELVRLMPDRQIARLLNRTGVETARQCLDARARARLPQSPRHRRVPRRRVGGARRDYTRSGSKTHRRLHHDGVTYAPPRRHQRPTSLRGRALGDQGRGLGRFREGKASEASANTKCHAAGP